MLKLVTRKIIKEGKVEEAIKLYEELVTLSRKEEGCIVYELYQDELEHRIFAVIEDWENKEYLLKHTNSEHFKRLLPLIGELTEQKLDSGKYIKLI